MDTKSLEIRNQKIIDAVLKKAERDCPGSLAALGIYGSFVTGDIHPRSDLDLLILINDDQGDVLSRCFIQDDLGVGHDIYCTRWEWLEEDAKYSSPNIGKLMDSKMLYFSDKETEERFMKLREDAREVLAAPFSKEDFEKAEGQLKEALNYFVKLILTEDLAEGRAMAGAVLYYLEDAVAMLNKHYFRLGARRIYEELNSLEKRPEKLTDLIEDLVSADSLESLKQAGISLVRETSACFETVKKSFEEPKEAPSADNLRGTYEEMVSNWRGKMHLAAEIGDRHLAFTSLDNLDAMLEDIAAGAAIEKPQAMAAYDPKDLNKSEAGYDEILKIYAEEYRKAGLQIDRFPDIDAFVKAYLEE